MILFPDCTTGHKATAKFRNSLHCFHDFPLPACLHLSVSFFCANQLVYCQRYSCIATTFFFDFASQTMSQPQREAYQLPSHRDGSVSGSQGGNHAAYSTFATGTAAGDSSAGPTVQYICGECNSKVSLGRGDAIRCSMCGHRVLYKERTKRCVIFSDPAIVGLTSNLDIQERPH